MLCSYNEFLLSFLARVFEINYIYLHSCVCMYVLLCNYVHICMYIYIALHLVKKFFTTASTGPFGPGISSDCHNIYIYIYIERERERDRSERIIESLYSTAVPINIKYHSTMSSAKSRRCA